MLGKRASSSSCVCFFSSGRTEMIKVLSNFIHLDPRQQERAGLGRVSDLQFDSLQRYNGK